MAEHRLQVGDKVTWKSHGGYVEGKVIKVATSDGHKVDT